LGSLSSCACRALVKVAQQVQRWVGSDGREVVNGKKFSASGLDRQIFEVAFDPGVPAGLHGAMPLPKVFIGSSVKGLTIARAIRSQLQHEADVTLWNEGVFAIMSTALTDLLKAVEGFDFAIFVFFPEDSLLINDNAQLTVRDNVLFELGLFIGSIGRERCFFAVPKKQENVRIPSDLDGIYPAKYDAEHSSVRAGVGDACFHILEAINRIGTLGQSRERTLYQSGQPALDSSDFSGMEAKIWKEGKPFGEVGRGTLDFPQGMLRISRTNTEGRFEVHLRPNGKGAPSFRRMREPALRRIRVTCDARAERGDHDLHFVLKDENADKWLGNQTVKVTAGDWASISLAFKVAADVDLLLRIDDQKVSAAPSVVSIRNLLVKESE
jgi:predicted nucleotide-binding protein